MKQYQKFLTDILLNGTVREDRTSVGTISIFGYQMRFNLQDGFPLVTTKRVPFKSVLSELLWFIEGSSDERRLAEIHYGKPRDQLIGKTTIWTANANAQGVDKGFVNTDLVKIVGRGYGFQWRNWNEIDQLANLIEGIKTNPDSRRHILTAWNVADLDLMALPPCHCFAQFYVADGKLSCHLYQRSADAFLGSPFNIASYSLLTHMIAQVCDLDVGEFVYSIGDAHIYLNHVEQVQELLSREPKPLPKLYLNPNIKNINDFCMASIDIDDYISHPTIKAEMAV